MEKHYTVQTGDTFAGVCERFGVQPGNVDGWQSSFPGFDQACQLMPGDEFDFYFHRRDSEPLKLVYSPQKSPVVFTFSREDTGWQCRKEEVALETVTRTVTGTIDDNLFDSAVKAGAPAGMILQLADLFAYDIDFNTDLQQGDTFSFFVEEQMRGDKPFGSARILAAEMNVNGERHQAFYYELPDGKGAFFDAEGHLLQKMFLKSPLSYSRISSTFTYHRLHPILKTVRPHLGIDYAAQTGTPVSALGDGVVSFIGKKGGFGKAIEIKHNGTYRTSYAHLSRFASGLRVGSKVEQGQVIGYVGSTGLATGPHLDFRFYRDGKPINFLTTKFAQAKSIPGQLLADFERKHRLYVAELQKGLQPDEEELSSIDHTASKKPEEEGGDSAAPL